MARKVGLYIGRDPVEGSGEADAKVGFNSG